MRVLNAELDSEYKEKFTFLGKNPGSGHLFVRFKSNAVVLTSEGYKNAKPGDFMFYDRNEIVEYGTADGAFVHDFFRFVPEEGEGDELSVPTSRLFTFPLGEKISSILKMIAMEFYSDSENKNEYLSLLCKLFLLKTDELIRIKTEQRESGGHALLLKLRSTILSAPQRNYTIKEIAKMACMSPSYFQSVYKRTFGTSCMNELIRARISRAEYFLKKTDKKESEIASLCGYNSVEHFVRQFKRFTGQSPSEYRK